jgi:hypothetical protein
MKGTNASTKTSTDLGARGRAAGVGLDPNRRGRHAVQHPETSVEGQHPASGPRKSVLRRKESPGAGRDVDHGVSPVCGSAAGTASTSSTACRCDTSAQYLS